MAMAITDGAVEHAAFRELILCRGRTEDVKSSSRPPPCSVQCQCALCTSLSAGCRATSEVKTPGF